MVKHNKYLVSNKAFNRQVRRERLARTLMRLLVLTVIGVGVFFLGQAQVNKIHTHYQEYYLTDLGVTPPSTMNYPLSMLFIGLGSEQVDGQEVPRVQMTTQVVIDKEHNQTTVATLPTNTIPSWNKDSAPISHLYAESGRRTLIDEIQNIVARQYDYISLIHLGEVRSIVDTLGKVPVVFNQEVNLEGEVLQPGKRYTLDGRQIELLIQRDPHESSANQSERLQAILAAVLAEASEYKHFLNLGRVIKKNDRAIETNVPWSVLASYYLGRFDKPLEQVDTRVLGGTRTQNKYGEVLELSPHDLEQLSPHPQERKESQ